MVGPIRVAFIAGQLNVGGAERQLLYLARDLDRERFAPVVIHLRRDGPLSPLFRASGIDLVELGYRGRGDMGIVARIRRVLLERRIQVACPYLWPATLWGYAALRWAGVPHWIASERNSGAVYDPPLGVALESRILARADALVAITAAARAFAVSRGVRPERIRVIRIGVPQPAPARDVASVKRELGIEPDAPLVGCVARIGPQKDHATLVEAAALVLRRVPRVQFVFVGDGELRAATEAQCAHLGLAGHVHFPGMRLDAMDFLNACDVSVLASSKQEGCSNSLVESALLSKPVVATRVGGIPEAVSDGETGYLVPPEQPAAMAEAITRLLLDQPLAARMGASGKALAQERFGLRMMVAGWESLLSEVAARNGT